MIYTTVQRLCRDVSKAVYAPTHEYVERAARLLFMTAAHESRIRLRLELVAAFGTAQQNIALKSAAEALARQNANSPLAHFALGIALTGMEQERPENMDDGIKEIEKAHELAPADDEIAASLGNVYEITASNRAQENKPAEAEEYRKKADDVYRNMIKADPDQFDCGFFIFQKPTL